VATDQSESNICVYPFVAAALHTKTFSQWGVYIGWWVAENMCFPLNNAALSATLIRPWVERRGVASDRSPFPASALSTTQEDPGLIKDTAEEVSGWVPDWKERPISFPSNTHLWLAILTALMAREIRLLILPVFLHQQPLWSALLQERCSYSCAESVFVSIQWAWLYMPTCNEHSCMAADDGACLGVSHTLVGARESRVEGWQWEGAWTKYHSRLVAGV